ncbi:unnamed protein product, partial [Brenthis ino]
MELVQVIAKSSIRKSLFTRIEGRGTVRLRRERYNREPVRQSAAKLRRARTVLVKECSVCVHVMEEIRISDWPEPPGSHAWLPAYGFQHEIMEKEDYFGSNGEFCSLDQTMPLESV